MNIADRFYTIKAEWFLEEIIAKSVTINPFMTETVIMQKPVQ